MTDFSSIKMYLYNGVTAVDITADVQNGLTAEWGISGNSVMDRLAGTGRMEFVLNNSTKKYSPGSATHLAYFKKGAVIELVFSYESIERKRLRYYIDEISVAAGIYASRTTTVTALDWLEYSATYPFISPAYASNKRGDEALGLIVPSMPKQPQETTYGRGRWTFPVLFDGTTTKTKAYTEFSKLTFSELGYMYLRKERGTGENLTFEGAYERHGGRTLTPIPVSSASSGALLKEDGGYLLKEDGGKLLLNQTQTATFSSTMMDMSVEYGQNVINRFTTIINPRRLDTANAVLFTLNNPMTLESGVVNSFRAQYSDPIGGARVNAISTSMVTPVINTDYKVWTVDDGTGTDLTADLVITAVYGTEGVTYELTNTNAEVGYLTLLQARGLGVYSFNPTETSNEDTDSIAEYGYQSETLHQPYKKDTAAGKEFGMLTLAREREPRTKLQSVTLVANKTEQMMEAFLTLDVGDLVYIVEPQTAIDGYYFIQSFSLSIISGQNVAYTWGLREFLTIGHGVTGMVLSAFGESNYEHFVWNNIPQILSLSKRTISAWVYVENLTDPSTICSMSGNSVEYAFWFLVDVTGKIKYNSNWSGADGSWGTDESIAVGGWHHLVVTYDSSLVSNVPSIYIDGVLGTISIGSVQPTGTYQSETGKTFNMGFLPDIGANPEVNHSLYGHIQDLRIYNGIVDAAGIAAIHSYGAYTVDPVTVDNMTGGSAVRGSYLRFQAPCVLTSDLVSIDGIPGISLDNKVFDNFYFAAGSEVPGFNRPVIQVPF